MSQCCSPEQVGRNVECITLSLESAYCLIPSALHKSLFYFIFRLLTTLTLHHTLTISFQAQNSRFLQIFSTIACLHGLPSLTILNRTYSAQRVHF